jgi:nucleoside-diphosphate-sugar epimerase
MKILITGGNGYVAKSLYNSFKNQYDVTSITRQDFDLTAFQAMNDFFQDKYFDVVIHCAAQGGSRLKPDSSKDMDVNLTMYYNLLQHKPHYAKLLHFGSGAEIHNPESFYGLSKRVIAKSILETDSFYNIRIFGVFDESEWDTRFIKACIKRYLNKEPMMIQNKKMSFFYMKDLITLVDHYVQSTSSVLLKESNCAYADSVSLLDIATFINSLGDYEVPIYVDTQIGKDYESNLNAPYSLKYVGLKQGIKETYDNILHQHSKKRA